MTLGFPWKIRNLRDPQEVIQNQEPTELLRGSQNFHYSLCVKFLFSGPIQNLDTLYGTPSIIGTCGVHSYGGILYAQGVGATTPKHLFWIEISIYIFQRSSFPRKKLLFFSCGKNEKQFSVGKTSYKASSVDLAFVKKPY